MNGLQTLQQYTTPSGTLVPRLGKHLSLTFIVRTQVIFNNKWYGESSKTLI